MVWHDLWPTFQWPRHLSRLARRWWSGAISVWISWRTSCVLATLIYDPQLSKEICPFPRLDVIGQSLYTIFVSIIQWHTALLPPLQLQRRVECQGHGLDSPWRVALRESSPDTAAIIYIYTPYIPYIPYIHTIICWIYCIKLYYDSDYPKKLPNSCCPVAPLCLQHWRCGHAWSLRTRVPVE